MTYRLFIPALLLLCATLAQANSDRLALVIGNSAYASSPLKNPVNDAKDMATALKSMGFEVMLKTNVDRRQLREALREFGDRLDKRSTGLFFYAGHGMQVNGENYLIPVGSDIEREDEVPDEGLKASSVLRKMESAGNDVNIVILDACRNNPFARSFRSTSRGLARMEGPSGSIIAYSTEPGSVAADGDGRNGTYTKHLLQAMRAPNQPIELVFKDVRRNVEAETRGKQVPWEASSLKGNFYFVADAATPAVPATTTASNRPEQYPFSIETIPADARIRILNIGPRYQPGMLLAPGQYTVEVSSPGYLTEQRAVQMASAPLNLKVQLQRQQPIPQQPVPQPTAAVAPAPVAPVSLPQIHLDRYMKELLEARDKKHSEDIGKLISKIQAHLEQHKLNPPSDFWFYQAQWQLHIAKPAEAQVALNHYLKLTGQQGTYYNQALDAYSEAESALEQQKQRQLREAKEKAEAEAKAAAEAKAKAEEQRQFAIRNDQARALCANASQPQPTNQPLPKVNKDAPEMIVVPGGLYEREGGLFCIKPFAIGKTEVTQSQWYAVMKTNPSQFSSWLGGSGQLPVENVSWHDAQEYLAKLNQQTGAKFRLPSELEWEYACTSGGQAQTYCGGEAVNDLGWNQDNSNHETHPVASKTPNGLGLYDMSGNVWEWVQDCYHDSYQGVPADGSARESESCKSRVLRGGSWYSFPSNLRSADRNGHSPGFRYNDYGFRLVQDLD